MHIADALPNGAPPLKLRCQDKNHDLGDQTLNVSEEYKFKFKGQFFGVVADPLALFSLNVIGRCKKMAFILEAVKMLNLRSDTHVFEPLIDNSGSATDSIYLDLFQFRVDTMATKYLNLRFKFGGILVSEVGPVYVGDRTEYVENVDEDHLSIPELADYAKSFGISKDTIDIYVCDDTILEDVGPNEGQISQSLSQVVESFNAYGKPNGSLTAQQKNPDLRSGSSSSFPSSERVENDGVARVQQETDDDYSSIDWTDTEEEGEPTVQQETEPSIQEEVEPSAQENAEEDIDSDSICSDQSMTMEVMCMRS
ncbi:hypothetical protein KY289_006004 [Solanum tuberosum]|nr:hypothetical protein KY289_006004 [Solanum tuberosum]